MTDTVDTSKEAVERVIAASVQVEGVTLSSPPPGRHHTILNAMSLNMGMDAIELGSPDAQGFLTSKGRHVGRIEAAKIAIEAGQIESLNWPPNLYSEDLW